MVGEGQCWWEGAAGGVSRAWSRGPPQAQGAPLLPPPHREAVRASRSLPPPSRKNYANCVPQPPGGAAPVCGSGVMASGIAPLRLCPPIGPRGCLSRGGPAPTTSLRPHRALSDALTGRFTEPCIDWLKATSVKPTKSRPSRQPLRSVSAC